MKNNEAPSVANAHEKGQMQGVGSGTLVSRLFGFPIWTEDHDGEIRARRARFLPDGRIVTSKIYGKIVGNADGTFSRGYVSRWYPRQTIFG